MEAIMAKMVQAFADNNGQIHASAEYAIIADLTNILGRVGAEAGITQGLAQLILKKRSDIERAFADFDAISIHQEGPQ